MAKNAMKPEEKASEIYSWMQAACHECADGNEIGADDLWNEVETLSDLLSDKVYNDSKGHPGIMFSIVTCLKEMGHPPLIKACDEFLANHRLSFG
jgi:hypothetical protein